MTKKTYSKTSEAAIRELASQGMGYERIADQLNVSRMMLRATACTLGISLGKGAGRLTVQDAQLTEWIDRLAAGDLVAEIAGENANMAKKIYSRLSIRGLPTTTRAAVKFKALQASKAA